MGLFPKYDELVRLLAKLLEEDKEKYQDKITECGFIKEIVS